MADFCKQCSIDTFGKDYGDMKNISTIADTRKRLYAATLCEDCGPTQVDHTGKCIAKYCSKKHGQNS